jgi:hypothetical protein
MKPLALRLFVFAVLLVLAAAWTKEGLSSFLPPCTALDFLVNKENCCINANIVKIMKSSDSTMRSQPLKVLM